MSAKKLLEVAGYNMSGKKLLDSDSEEEEMVDDSSGSKEFKINQSYAESYNRFREKEHYQKLKDKYGEDAAKRNLDDALGDDDESTSESEDEDAEALTEEVEKDFFKTLAMLKTKDPRIYSQETTFFTKPKGIVFLQSVSRTFQLITIRVF